MPAYDGQYNPPAPIADLTIAHPVSGAKSAPLSGKLDTGAGLSVIPQRVIVQLALSPHSRIWARSYDRAYSRRLIYFAHFVLEGNELAAVQCLAVERETALIGRNVLNRFAILLDGPKLRFELKASG